MPMRHTGLPLTLGHLLTRQSQHLRANACSESAASLFRLQKQTAIMNTPDASSSANPDPHHQSTDDQQSSLNASATGSIPLPDGSTAPASDALPPSATHAAAHRVCDVCGTTISWTQLVCPECGKPCRSMTLKRRITIFEHIALGLAACVNLCISAYVSIFIIEVFGVNIEGILTLAVILTITWVPPLDVWVLRNKYQTGGWVKAMFIALAVPWLVLLALIILLLVICVAAMVSMR